MITSSVNDWLVKDEPLFANANPILYELIREA